MLLILQLLLQTLPLQALDKPNVLLFLVDDLGYGDLGFTGHPTSSSPNIDSLAKESVELTQFYTSSALCTPSRAGLLTGRHAVSWGLHPDVLFPDSLYGLPLEAETLAESLAEQGYRTAMAGKWHLGVGKGGAYLPTRQGFGKYYGLPYSNDMCPFTQCYPGEDGSCDLPSPHTSFTGCPLYVDESIVEQPVDLTTLTHRYTQFAEDFLREESDSPFFLYFAFNHVHFPQFSSSMFRNSSIRGPFGDSVAEVDWAVGKLVSVLEQQGILNNTLIVLSSDNGPRYLDEGKGQGGSAGPFRCGKGTTYEGGHRVPGLLHWKGVLKPRREMGLVSMMDLYPTILSLAGGSPGPHLHGINLAPSLLNEEPSPRQEIFYINPFDPQQKIIYALREGKYKAHWQTMGWVVSTNHDDTCTQLRKDHSPPLLYNLESDPGELYQLTEEMEPAYKEILAKMEARKKELEGGEVEWAEPVMDRGEGVMPCCSPGCSPYPACCSCQHL